MNFSQRYNKDISSWKAIEKEVMRHDLNALKESNNFFL